MSRLVNPRIKLKTISREHVDVICVSSSSLGPGHASVVEPEVLEHPLARPDVARDQVLVDLDRGVAARSGLNT